MLLSRKMFSIGFLSQNDIHTQDCLGKDQQLEAHVHKIADLQGSTVMDPNFSWKDPGGYINFFQVLASHNNDRQFTLSQRTYLNSPKFKQSADDNFKFDENS